MLRYDLGGILYGAIQMASRANVPVVDCIAAQTDSGSSFFEAVKQYAKFSGGVYPAKHEATAGRDRAVANMKVALSALPVTK